MRLKIVLLNSDATVNKYKQIDSIKIAQGETVDIIFQLQDADQDGLRYIPAAGATVQVTIPRSTDILRVDFSSRETVNYTIDRPAGQAFAEDKSIFKLPLIEADTSKMVSTLIRIVVTEGSTKKIATLSQAIQIIN